MRIEAFSLNNIDEFEDHKVVNFLYNVGGLYGIVAVHSMGADGLACFGASRLWCYHSYNEAIRDVLRLSKTMSYKSIMAGLPYGGAKGVIMGTPFNLQNRKMLFSNYANHIKGVGNFITGADVGLTIEDLVVMRKTNSSIVGLKGDPVRFTALGMYCSIQLCLGEIFGSEDISNRTFAIQGLGNIGIAILHLIYGRAKRIVVADIDDGQVQIAKSLFPNIEIISSTEIHKVKVDVFSPCAMGGILNKKSVDELNCKIIVGGANNQLEHKDIGADLFNKGILYAPDYVVNAGGLITVTDEYENRITNIRRISNKVMRIKDTLKLILEMSALKHKATNLIADEIAEKRFIEQGWLRNNKKLTPVKLNR
jgi:leucine dehydrogenase